MGEERRVVICSPTAREADIYAREHDVPRRLAIYAGSVSKILGLRDFDVVELPYFRERRDAEQILDHLERNKAKQGESLHIVFA